MARLPLLLALCLPAVVARAEIPLTTGPFRDIEVKRLPDGVLDLQVSGPSPHFWSAVLPESFDPAKHTVLAFDYFSPSGIGSFSVRFRQPDQTMVFAGSAEIPLAETWQPFAIDLSEAEPALLTGGKGQRFHFSMRRKLESGMQIRNLIVREPNAEERVSKEKHEQEKRRKEIDAAAILSYFRAEYPAKIQKVTVGKEDITIVGHAPEPLLLRELRPVHASHHLIPDPPVAEELRGDFTIALPRFVSPGNRDRAFSRWRLESPSGVFYSPSRWADEIEKGVAHNLPRLTASHQKGLGGMPDIGTADHEIFELGIKHATINFVLNGLLSERPRRGWEKIYFEGKPFYLNRSFLKRRQTTVQRLREKGILVTAILLVGNHGNSSLVHPSAESRGKFAMPNLKTPEGTAHYQAALRVVANHFSSPATRVSNWVIHNEIDQAGTWTNMGDQPLARYLETYHRSARLVYLATRLRDPHSRVFISLTHHWAKQSSGIGTYVVRDMLELFNEMGRVEGDYEWGVGYHPYPRDLRNPDTWNDRDVTMEFTTPYITPKNLEVLPFFLQQDRFLYQGKPRGILLSEQGFNTPTLSEMDQRRQVAGLVYLFRKLPRFPVIEAFHLHRYRDMPEREGGLRLGIMDENGNRKLGWEAYRSFGTEQWTKFEAIADEVIADEVIAGPGKE